MKLTINIPLPWEKKQEPEQPKPPTVEDMVKQTFTYIQDVQQHQNIRQVVLIMQTDPPKNMQGKDNVGLVLQTAQPMSTEQIQNLLSNSFQMVELRRQPSVDKSKLN